MEARENPFVRWYYKNASKFFMAIFGRKVLKEFYEMYFWKRRKKAEDRLSNEHYAYFFTTYFGLTEEDYTGKCVMDIGCGPRGSLEWASMVSERIGLDSLADKYVALEGKHHKMSYVQAGAESIPYPDGYFDIVTSFNSLDHVDDLKKAISEIKRVVKKDGLFLLIGDIHSYPTICEPSNFDWTIVDQFLPEFEKLQEHHYEGNMMYKSIREGVPFDHNNPRERYGIVTAIFKRL